MSFDSRGQRKIARQRWIVHGPAWRSCLWLISIKISYLAGPIRRQSLLSRSSFCASRGGSQQPHLALRERNLNAIGLERPPYADVQGRFQVSLTFFGVVDPDRELEVEIGRASCRERE